jgi:transmembrane sensor
MDENRFSDLLNNYLTGTMTEPERKELSAMLGDPGYQKVLEQQLLQELEGRRFESQGHEDALALVQQHLTEQLGAKKGKRLFVFPKWFAAAAAALIIICIGPGFFWWRKSLHEHNLLVKTNTAAGIRPGSNRAVLSLDNGVQIPLDDSVSGEVATQGGTEIVKTDSAELRYRSTGESGSTAHMNTLSTPRGGTFRLVLPDGSRVWLNAASSITFPTVFTGKSRTVTISGEAYFEVAQDKEKPFRVHLNDIDIGVLGTHFNVNAYGNEQKIRTTLLEGKIELTKGRYRTVLSPGDQAFSGAEDMVVRLDAEDLERQVAWKSGLFDFDNADLPVIMRQLERWYDIQVRYEGDVPQRRFRGELSRALELNDILEVLREVNVRYRIEGRTLIIEK